MAEGDHLTEARTLYQRHRSIRHQDFAALFARMGDTGKIWNERKFKHVTETDQIFEFKVEADRILCFFFVGRRLILTHGFKKASDRTPKREINCAEAYKKDFEGRGKHAS